MSKAALSKKDFINLIANQDEFDTKADAEKALNAVIDGIKKALSNGEKISLVGFGNFEVKHKPERQGRNPSTGEALTIKR